MFKFKAGNVFQKLNKMDRKKAYTLGALIVVCFIALLTLASFMGKADDASFDDFSTRGYDLAQMPFVNDEAEQYLLAAKYPDMQNNGSTLLYSAEEKEARQEEDAQNEEEYTDDSSSGSSAYEAPTSRGYAGYGRGGGGTSSPTQVGQLGSASMGHASGSGINSSYGAPRGDFSPYKSQEKGSELPTVLQNKNARKALWQTARGSRAAAGLRDGKGGNAKRAMMGGNIQGADAFTDKGVDLSKAAGLALDTNAPVTSSDLSNLDDAVSDTADKANDDKNQEEKDLWDKLLEQALSGLVNIGVQAIGNLANRGIDAMFAAGEAGTARSQATDNALTGLMGISDVSQATPLQQQQMKELGLNTSNCGGMSFSDCVGTNPPAWASDWAGKYRSTTTATQDQGQESTLNVGATDPKKLQAQQDKERDDLMDAMKDRIHSGTLKRNATVLTLGYNEDGSRITESSVYHDAYYTRMGSKTYTPISYNANQGNTNNSEGLNVYLSEHCTNCTVGSTAYNDAVAEYNKKYGKK